MLGQVFVQTCVISRLDYCIALLRGLLARALRPLQMVQQHILSLITQSTHVMPLFRSLWLPVAARIQLKALENSHRMVMLLLPVQPPGLTQVHLLNVLAKFL